MKRRSFLSLFAVLPFFRAKPKEEPIKWEVTDESGYHFGNSAIPCGTLAESMEKGSAEAAGVILRSTFRMRIIGPTTWRDAT